MNELESALRSDIEAVARIDIVPTILEVVCRTTRMGFVAVARVTENRWIACSVRDDIQFGLRPGGELRVETTICNEIRQHGRAVVIDDVTRNAEFCQHDTPAMYGFKSYISMPIVLPDGSFFGTLCAIDPNAARLDTPEVVGMFQLFSQLIGFHLDAQQRLAAAEASLMNERRTAELREQFIAVLGHDLRNPLAAIVSGARLIQKTPLNDQASLVLAMMQNSVKRMTGLIDNVLDFARGRLGGGLTLERHPEEHLQPVLQQVIDELQSAWPNRIIHSNLQVSEPVSCDPMRIGQLVSNLISNALNHGAAGSPVIVEASIDASGLQLSVTNTGERIPAPLIDRLFEPFVRAALQPNQQGLGLGLYIANEIARAHGGSLTVHSTAEATQFTFRMPVNK